MRWAALPLARGATSRTAKPRQLAVVTFLLQWVFFFCFCFYYCVAISCMLALNVVLFLSLAFIIKAWIAAGKIMVGCPFRRCRYPGQY